MMCESYTLYRQVRSDSTSEIQNVLPNERIATLYSFYVRYAYYTGCWNHWYDNILLPVDMLTVEINYLKLLVMLRHWAPSDVW